MLHASKSEVKREKREKSKERRLRKHLHDKKSRAKQGMPTLQYFLS